ncbi:MAG TPA: hypothetical protein VK154_08110 [Chitinophagales bacterium]|nr:hypothetical protein [Chitinophagales bacterium]
MANRKRKKKSAEELGTENELLKLKMMAEFGGDFMGGEDLPPEVENQFLKQVMSFHKMHDKSELVAVYKFIGEPEYNHVNDLSDKEIDSELKKIIKLMNKNSVALSWLPETPKREIYRFITEELFKHEIESVKVKGWVNQFIYEEFYPNPEFDVRNAVAQCLQTIFNRDHIFFDDQFSEDMKDNIGLSMEVDDFRERMEGFRNQFNNIKLEEYKCNNVEINNEAGIAHAVYTVTYKTQREKGRKFKAETAVVEINLERSKMMDSWWEIKQVVTDLF